MSTPKSQRPIRFVTLLDTVRENCGLTSRWNELGDVLVPAAALP